MKKRVWTVEEDNFLEKNFFLTNEELAVRLNCSEATVKARFKSIGLERPAGKNLLSRARHKICREMNKEGIPAEWFDLPLTRADAKALNIQFYWTGIPCERAGHISRRKTSSGGCWDCDYGDHLEKLRVDQSYVEKRTNSRLKRYAENRVEYLEKQREYKKLDHVREWHRNYEKTKKKEDMEFRLAKSLRDRLYKAVTRDFKAASAVQLVGCSMGQLKRHLETLFSAGMSWENYGEWHIDHIRPCVSFDLTDPVQQEQCFHYTNLRPLWAFDNQSKGGEWGGVDPRARLKNPKDD